tara:strand:- start:271 stop:438 length:168 start_codon:yes stop_codon:yes gene_type:complete
MQQMKMRLRKIEEQRVRSEPEAREVVLWGMLKSSPDNKANEDRIIWGNRPEAKKQ